MEVREREARAGVLEACPYCSCGCGLHLLGAGAERVGVGPSEHHPVSGGRLCAKGWAAHEAPLWGPRILHPLVRKDGRLEPCSWDQAISHAADALSRLVSAGRPVGVLGSGRASNEENFLAAALARTALRTGHVDAPLRAPYEDLVRGLGAGSGIPALDSSLEHLAASDLILLLEGDLAATHPRAAFALLQALRRGGRLVTLGWSPTRMSRLAAAHLTLPPGDPLRPLCELLDTLRGGGDAPPVGAQASVPEVASWLAASRRPALVLGFPQVEATVLEAAASLLVQALREAGTRDDGRTVTLVPLPVRANSRGAREMGAAPHLLPGCRALGDPGARDRLTKAWGREPCREQGLSAADMLGAVQGLVVVSEDPVVSAPSPSRALHGLKGLDSLVVLDSYLTPTALAARVVLPVAAFGEGWGTLTNLEGRVQCWRPLVRPPGEAREGWSVLAKLLDAMGAPASFGTFEDVFAAVGRAVPEYAPLDLRALHDGPGAPLGAPVWPLTPHPASEQAGALPADNSRWVVRTDGAFEWGDDPLVGSSPTLRRDPASFRKLHPDGVVWISPEEAKALGIREGWKVRLRSSSGEAEVPVSLRPGLGRRLLLVPFTFRDELWEVLGGAEAAEVELSRT
ncbi:MAG TPA: molybdopterin-dependent oxidoreductase [Longimicrobiales bacterium]|nr:molybdopterin-dependent oxidoreductase [Longimicrobiales bacterium]